MRSHDLAHEVSAKGPSEELPDVQHVSPSASRHSRFIGDLNPEAIFLAATTPDATRGTTLEDSIGVWLTTKLDSRGSEGCSPILPSSSSLFHASGVLTQQVMAPLLEHECLSMIPPAEHLAGLSSLFFEKVYLILPIVGVKAAHNPRLAKSDGILLLQGICLAASKNDVAKQHLFLGESIFAPLTCRDFGDRISGAMRLSLEMGLVKDKIVMIQALALLSQFIDTPAGEDLSSQ